MYIFFLIMIILLFYMEREHKNIKYVNKIIK